MSQDWYESWTEGKSPASTPTCPKWHPQPAVICRPVQVTAQGVLPAAKLSLSVTWSLIGMPKTGWPSREVAQERALVHLHQRDEKLLLFAPISPSLCISNRAGKGTGFCRYGLQSGTALRPCWHSYINGDGKRQKVTTSDCGNNSAQENLFVILRVILKSHKPCQHAALGNFWQLNKAEHQCYFLGRALQRWAQKRRYGQSSEIPPLFKRSY